VQNAIVANARLAREIAVSHAASTVLLAWAIALAPGFTAATLGRFSHLAHLARRRRRGWGRRRARHGALLRRRHCRSGLPLHLRLGAGLHLRLHMCLLGLHLSLLCLLSLSLHLRLGLRPHGRCLHRPGCTAALGKWLRGRLG
jgi:hypothetical protein